MSSVNDRKVSQLDPIQLAQIDPDDLFMIVDHEDLTFGPGGTNKRIDLGTFVSYLLTTGQFSPSIPFPVFGGRLSASAAGNSTDVASSSTLYYVPGDPATYSGNSVVSVPDYLSTDPTAWALMQIPAGNVPSLSLSTVSAGVYDVFAYYIPVGGTNTLFFDLVRWSSPTMRSSAVAVRSGTIVNAFIISGTVVNNHSIPAGSAVLVGTVYLPSTGTTSDMPTQRFVANVYNRIPRYVACNGTISHSYNLTTLREWNNGVGITKGQVILPLPQTLQFTGMCSCANFASAGFGYGNDPANNVTLARNFTSYNENTGLTTVAMFDRVRLPAGYNNFSVIEASTNGISGTFTSFNGGTTVLL